MQNASLLYLCPNSSRGKPLFNQRELPLERVCFIPTKFQVWRLGCWEGAEGSGPLRTTFPIPPVELLLHEPDVLRDYVRRAGAIGWLSRQQFEELWVSLLGVFGASTGLLEEEPEAGEAARSVAVVVHALTAVIAQTMLLPVPGQNNISSPIHHSRQGLNT